MPARARAPPSCPLPPALPPCRPPAWLTASEGHGGNIQDENIDKTSNAPGTLSMANTGQPNSGGSQFFVNVADNSNLNWFSGGRSKHPVFGKIVDGYETAVAISKVKTSRDAPDTPVKMNGITIVGI